MGKLGHIDLGREATYQDVLDAPESVVAELIEGQLYAQARPRMKHGRLHVRLATLLGAEFEEGLGRAGGWYFVTEPELHLGGDVMVPDLAGWRVECYPDGADEAVGMTVPPNWLCEILSPTTTAKDRVLKLPRYAAAGVQWAWLVDAVAQTIEVYRNDGDNWVLDRTVVIAESAYLPPFESLDLPLGRIRLEI